MTAEDLLWVGIKILGVYFIVQGIQGVVSLLIAGATQGALVLQLATALVVGFYLLVGGGWIVRLAGRRP